MASTPMTTVSAKLVDPSNSPKAIDVMPCLIAMYVERMSGAPLANARRVKPESFSSKLSVSERADKFGTRKSDASNPNVRNRNPIEKMITTHSIISDKMG